jgi:hypothetical protein
MCCGQTRARQVASWLAGLVYVGLGLVVGLLALVTWTLRQRDS